MNIEIGKLLPALMFFSLFLIWGVATLAIPSAAVFAFLYKKRRGCCIIPLTFVDLISFVLIGFLWYFGWNLPGSAGGKDWGNVFWELGGLGFLFGFMLAIRMPIIWKHPEWRLRISGLTAAFILVSAALMGFLIPPFGGY